MVAWTPPATWVGAEDERAAAATPKPCRARRQPRGPPQSQQFPTDRCLPFLGLLESLDALAGRTDVRCPSDHRNASMAERKQVGGGCVNTVGVVEECASSGHVRDFPSKQDDRLRECGSGSTSGGRLFGDGGAEQRIDGVIVFRLLSGGGSGRRVA